jgi:hypothetical protein
MNYRTSPGENIASLEETFIRCFQLNIPTVPQTGSPSNKHTFHALFVSHNSNHGKKINIDNDDQTLLANSVFTDEFISETVKKGLSDADTLYYIIHPDRNFPTGSKHSALLSNMSNKNFSGKEQPPVIRKLLKNIDYNKMAAHIENLIEENKAASPDMERNLRIYIDTLLSTELSLADYCTALNCHTVADYLTCILLYALFDDINFKEYVNGHRDLIKTTNTAKQASSVRDEDSVPLIEEFRKSSFISKVTTYLLIALYVIQIICLTIPLAHSDMLNQGDKSFILFCIIMLSISWMLITLRILPFYFAQNTSRLQLALEYSLIHNYTEPLKKFKNNSPSYSSIHKNRKLLLYILDISVVFFLGLSIAFNSLPLLAAGYAATIAVLLMIDHIFHDIHALREYDKNTMPASSTAAPAVYRGMAKLYAWDYNEKTCDFKHRNIYESAMYSPTCMKYIFNEVVDRYNSLMKNSFAILTTTNIVAIIAGIFQYIFPMHKYFRLPNTTSFLIFSIGWIFINGIANIIILLKTDSIFNTITRFTYYSNDYNAHEKGIRNEFTRAYVGGIITDIDICRGVYNYCYARFDQGIPVDRINPTDDRMLYIHKNISTRVHFRLIGILLLLAYFCVFIWHFHSMAGLIILPALILIYVGLTCFIFPYVDRKLVISEIEKLSIPMSEQESVLP